MVAIRRTVTVIASCMLIALMFSTGCQQQAQQVETGLTMIGEKGVLHKASEIEIVERDVTPSESEQKKKEVAEKLDTQGLMFTGKVVTDNDPKLLEPMPHIAKLIKGDFVIAKEAPTVEFAVIPAVPLFLGEALVKSTSNISNSPGPWSNWSQANYDTRTGKFYSSIGDHAKYDAHILLVEYDPTAKKVQCLPEVNKVLGRTQDQFMEGKIHGWLDFYKSPDIDKEHLWYCTYWAKYPEPDEVDYATGYDGGHIMSYDVITGDIVDYGVPLKRASWPYHRVDTKRGIMYAIGMECEFLAWDINKQETKWAGYLPPGMRWNNRAILIDEVTGMVYTSNHDTAADPERHVLKYDPDKNRIYKLDCHMPATQGDSNRGKAGSISPMRAQTRDRGPEGLFWSVTSAGQLFTFNPEKEEVVDQGINWPGKQRYTCSMDRSPGGRYVYYLPGAHGHGYSDGSPVIQLDTQTGKKKVLAFMFPYFYDKYGYTPGGTFSIKLDDKGEKLFILWNGAFVEHEGNVEDSKSDTFGQCSVMVVNIPASERQE
ncbi:hypothetical protein ACFL47_05990 [Candidatus Latescibacterota bacterium]